MLDNKILFSYYFLKIIYIRIFIQYVTCTAYDFIFCNLTKIIYYYKIKNMDLMTKNTSWREAPIWVLRIDWELKL